MGEGTINTPYVERYADGQVIITEGIISTKAYLVVSGEVRISKKVDDKNIVVNTLGEGDVFGEMGLIRQGARTATATAIGDVTVGIIDQDYFNSLLDQCPTEIKPIINAIVERLRVTTDKLANIGFQWELAKRAMSAYSVRESSDDADSGD